MSLESLMSLHELSTAAKHSFHMIAHVTRLLCTFSSSRRHQPLLHPALPAASKGFIAPGHQLCKSVGNLLHDDDLQGVLACIDIIGWELSSLPAAPQCVLPSLVSSEGCVLAY